MFLQVELLCFMFSQLQELFALPPHQKLLIISQISTLEPKQEHGRNNGSSSGKLRSWVCNNTCWSLGVCLCCEISFLFFFVSLLLTVDPATRGRVKDKPARKLQKSMYNWFPFQHNKMLINHYQWFPWKTFLKIFKYSPKILFMPTKKIGMNSRVLNHVYVGGPLLFWYCAHCFVCCVEAFVEAVFVFLTRFH